MCIMIDFTKQWHQRMSYWFPEGDDEQRTANVNVVLEQAPELRNGMIKGCRNTAALAWGTTPGEAPLGLMGGGVQPALSKPNSTL